MLFLSLQNQCGTVRISFWIFNKKAIEILNVSPRAETSSHNFQDHTDKTKLSEFYLENGSLVVERSQQHETHVCLSPAVALFLPQTNSREQLSFALCRSSCLSSSDKIPWATLMCSLSISHPLCSFSSVCFVRFGCPLLSRALVVVLSTCLLFRWHFSALASHSSLSLQRQNFRFQQKPPLLFPPLGNLFF